MKFRLALLLTLVLATATACKEPTRLADPVLPAGAIALSPLPEVYETWWKETEKCSGLSGDFSGVRWYQLPGAHYFYIDGVAYDGIWWESRWILLAAGDLNDGALVRHEMLHDLVRRTGHPTEYFKQKCAGVVSPPSP